MILQTNLGHIENAQQYEETLEQDENVMICCGRMGPMCFPVYQSMIELEQDIRVLHSGTSPLMPPMHT